MYSSLLSKMYSLCLMVHVCIVVDCVTAVGPGSCNVTCLDPVLVCDYNQVVNCPDMSEELNCPCEYTCIHVYVHVHCTHRH